MVKKAVFLGSKKFGFNIFKTIYDANPSIDWMILCPPDFADTRTYFAEFQQFSQIKNLRLEIADTAEKVTEYAAEFAPDVMIVCGYYRILPTKLLDSISMGVWGIHNSLLPKYRGGSPLVWQLINNEEIVGSSFFKFTSGMDDGDILDQVKIHNSTGLTICEASELIEHEWIRKIPVLWAGFVAGNIQPYEQKHQLATYCAQRQESDGLIEWAKSALDVDAFIRAQDFPYPRAFFKLDEQTVKVVKHKIDPRKIYGTPGQIFQVSSDFVTVCCAGHSAIQIHEVEVNGKLLAAKSILNSVKIRLS
ncbi:MAG TPA: hypothetical protein DCW59_16985 [Alteromonas sp.]|nr:hypothetical protein [Alteromonas sp.]